MRTTGVLLLLVLIAGCGGDADADPKPSVDGTPETFTVSGTLLLTDYDGVNYANHGRAGEECWGEDGYDDIAAGASVVVRDPDGQSVGLGELSAGSVAHNVRPYADIPCEFAFTVEDVPAGEGIYSVEVAHRGQVPFSRDEAADLSLSLG